MAEDVFIIGAYMTKFGRHDDKDAVDLGAGAALAALDDAGVTINDIGVIGAGSLFNASAGMGQQIQKQIGQTGIPVFNVANACATGATAIRSVFLSIKSGETDMGLAVGVEQMGKMGLLSGGVGARPAKLEYTPQGRDGHVLPTEGILGTFTMPGVFAQAGMEYLYENGGTVDAFYKISEKNHAHSALNPLAQYQKKFSVDEIKNAPMISYPNTMPMCSPNTDGAAAVVLVSESKLRTMPLEVQNRAVKIAASVLATDPWVDDTTAALPDVNTCTRNAVDKAYEIAGIGPEDLDLVELHDCFATAELLHYDNLRLCPPGGAVEWLESGAPWRDGSTPVNVSGGLESKGHPIGATGVANVYEITTHLRGEAGDRQIPGAKVGMTHVIGLGSTCGIHILTK
jgi:acetyl-CoA acyltransferase